jgi:lysophospholipase L1-like esterase
MKTQCPTRAAGFRTAISYLAVGVVAGGLLLGDAEGSDVAWLARQGGAGPGAEAPKALPGTPSVAGMFPSALAPHRGDTAERPAAGSADRPRGGSGPVEPAPSLALSDDEVDDDEGPFLSMGPAELIQVAARRAKQSVPAKPSGFTILQIGDSHTAADYFTGEVRKILQARYGNGGVGYVDVGKPHPGVRSAVLSVSASSGWAYASLQKAAESNLFFLSGFDATATRGGETVSFTASQPVPYDQIEIEVATGPDYGTIDIAVDNLPPERRTLAAPEHGRLVFRITPEHRRADKVHRLVITTLDDRPTTISSVAIFDKGRGLSYSNVGFPGATIDIVNKYDPKMLDDELKRLAPRIVVLAFGTNEGFNDDLDLEHYRARYRTVIRKIRASLPEGQIVMVGPPRADRVATICLKEPQSAACKAARGEGELDQPTECPYQTPPRLDLVRQVQRDLAKQENIPFWDWSGIMPAKCGAHSWAMASPRLMASDHVHFTPEGYKVSANAFAAFLSPIVNQLRRQQYAFSNN